MSEYTVQITWHRKADEAYIDNQYSRGHEWVFDGGATVPASSSPHVVPLPYSIERNVDPEEAFVASLASCHMLFFLSIAAKQKWLVNQYKDAASGVMTTNDEGQLFMSSVILRPKVTFDGGQPSLEDIYAIHHEAHRQCFIANSVKTKVTIDAQL